MTINKNVRDWYYRWSIEELREECKRKGLSTKGGKKELVERLGKGVASPVKEPWQMTKAEYIESPLYSPFHDELSKSKEILEESLALANLPESIRVPARKKWQENYDFLMQGHKEWIKEALSEGKTVPPEVLAEYPEIQ